MDISFCSDTISTKRIIYTPSPFARSNLIHLQESGELTAMRPHTSRRENLASFLFFIVVSGSGQVEYDGTPYNLSTGDCVFINCSRPHSHCSSDDLWTLKWVHFYGPNMNSIYEKYTERGGLPVFRPHAGEPFISLLDQLHFIAGTDDYIRDMRIFEMLTRLLTMLMEESWNPSGTAHSLSKKQDLQQVKEYLDSHLGEKITLDDLASRFYINKFYLTRMFREQFGTPVNSYLARQRVTHAKQLLRFSDMTIEQIAAECGVSDPNYFSRLFRKIEGISPAEYRKKW